MTNHAYRHAAPAMILAATGLLAAGFAAACGSSDSGGGGPAGPTPSGGTPTITISSEGVTPRELRVSVGARVRVVNNDTRPRELQSNPHEFHTDCPAMNQPGTLPPGQSGMTGVFNEERACGYHDHATDNQDARFRGQVVVGGAAPGSPDDYY